MMFTNWFRLKPAICPPSDPEIARLQSELKVATGAIALLQADCSIMCRGRIDDLVSRLARIQNDQELSLLGTDEDA